MGTNYYAKIKLPYPLTFVVNSDEDLARLKEHLETLQPEIHLGKTSAGWNFLAQWNGGKYYQNYESFIEFIRDTDLVIYDEYSHPLSKLEFLKLVWEWKGQRHSDYDEVGYIKFPELDFYDGEWS